MKHSLSQDIGLSHHQIQFSSGLSHLSSGRPTFQHGVCLEELVLDVLVLPAVPSHRGDVLHHQLPGLRLAGPALPGEDDGLVLPAVPQLVPGPVRQGVSEEESVTRLRIRTLLHVRRELGEAVTAVLVYDVGSVERDLLVGVDADHQVGDGGLKTIVIIILITVRGQ